MYEHIKYNIWLLIGILSLLFALPFISPQGPLFLVFLMAFEDF